MKNAMRTTKYHHAGSDFRPAVSLKVCRHLQYSPPKQRHFDWGTHALKRTTAISLQHQIYLHK